jgi:hypothetical protein
MAGDEGIIRQLDMGYRLNVSRDLISAVRVVVWRAGPAWNESSIEGCALLDKSASQ